MATEIRTDEKYRRPKLGVRADCQKWIGTLLLATGGASANKPHSAKEKADMTASVALASRQPHRSISHAAAGANSKVPQPIPDTATPIAVLRQRTNHPPTTASIGTYDKATPSPIPTP